jgi:hypothetical protein
MLGVLHLRLESFRTMVNLRAVTPEHLLFQRLSNPTRSLGNQRTHHPHTWHRETDNKFRSYGKQRSILYPSLYTNGHKRACTIRAGNDKEGVIFHYSFSFRVSHAALRSHPYSAFTYTDDVMSYSHWHFFPYHTLHHRRSSTYLCTILLFSFFFLGTKG